MEEVKEKIREEIDNGQLMSFNQVFGEK